MWKNFGGLWFSPVLNMHALILQFIFSLCIAFLCSTISVLIMPFRAQLVISNWIYINYGCFWFSLTKVIHMLAYSFFAPSIYIWIICHRRACVDTILVKLLSCVWLFEIPWTVAYQAPPSMEFSRQEYWRGLPFPSPEDLPKPGIKPGLTHCRQTLYHLSHLGSPFTIWASVYPSAKWRVWPLKETLGFFPLSPQVKALCGQGKGILWSLLVGEAFTRSS